MSAKAIRVCIGYVICLAIMVATQGQSKRKKEPVTNSISVSEIKEYRKMFRVNDTPMDMVEETRTMCALPSSVYGPHYDPGVVYYINEAARRGIKTFSARKQFPVGAIIVKEKQERRTEDSVQIITVMKKVQPGGGESSWAYKMYDTKKWTEVKSPGQKEGDFNQTCIGCHRQYKTSDYISGKGIELLLKK
jgi:hypothetical protein